MRNMPSILVLTCAMFGPQAPVAAAPTISKSEIRSEPPSVTDKRLRDVVWDMFEQQDFRRKKAPTRPLDHVFLQTKIQTTHVSGLCRYDSVQIDLDRADPNDTGPGAQTRAVGLTSTSLFTFVSPPKADFETIVDYSRKKPLADCAGVSAKSPFFTARDEREATLGYRALIVLQDALLTGKKFPLECSLYPVESLPCASIIEAMKPEELASVDPCDSDYRGTVCHKLEIGGRLITVTTTGNLTPGPPAGEIVSVKLSSLIIWADSVVD